MKNYYETLEVSPVASDEIIEKAYKVLAKKYHPDLQTEGNKKESEEKMRQINEAYEVLKDSQKRREYDEKLEYEEKKRQDELYEKLRQQAQNPSNINQNYARTVEVKNPYSYENVDETSQEKPLTKEEKRRIRKLKNQRQKAMEKAQRQYEEELVKQGYRVIHHWTFREIRFRVLVILGILAFLWLIWIIPPTRKWIEDLSNENFIVKLIVDIIKSIFKTFGQMFKKG